MTPPNLRLLDPSDRLSISINAHDGPLLAQNLIERSQRRRPTLNSGPTPEVSAGNAPVAPVVPVPTQPANPATDSFVIRPSARLSLGGGAVFNPGVAVGFSDGPFAIGQVGIGYGVGLYKQNYFLDFDVVASMGIHSRDFPISPWTAPLGAGLQVFYLSAVASFRIGGRVDSLGVYGLIGGGFLAGFDYAPDEASGILRAGGGVSFNTNSIHPFSLEVGVDISHMGVMSSVLLLGMSFGTSSQNNNPRQNSNDTNTNQIAVPQPVRTTENTLPTEAPAPVHIQNDHIEINQRIEFDFNRSEIRPESYPLLNQIADLIRQHPEIRRLEIQGHADDRGTDEYNLSLSSERAAAVGAYLSQRGIGSCTLFYHGYGRTRPLVQGTSDEARSRNRRVEFVILQTN